MGRPKAGPEGFIRATLAKWPLANLEIGLWRRIQIRGNLHPMRVFFTAFFGALLGKVVAALLLAILVFIGFGPDKWVQILTSWFSDPLKISLELVRIVAILIAVTIGLLLLWSNTDSLFRKPTFVLEFVSSREIKRNVPLFQLGQELPNKATFVHLRVSATNRPLGECTGMTCH